MHYGITELFTYLNDKGLRCRLEKCVFAEDTVTYLRHTIRVYAAGYINRNHYEIQLSS